MNEEQKNETTGGRDIWENFLKMRYPGVYLYLLYKYLLIIFHMKKKEEGKRRRKIQKKGPISLKCEFKSLPL